jgi:hypothetical protein
MRRFGRWLFNGLAIVSLVLCVATLFVWAWSYHSSERFIFPRWEREGEWIFRSANDIGVGSGGIGFEQLVAGQPSQCIESIREEQLADKRSPHYSYPPAYPDFPWFMARKTFGFSFGHFAEGQAGNRPLIRNFEIIAPLWFPAILLSVPPSIWLARQRRKRKLRGCCAKCGYNLTGNVSGVCPECGTPITSKT